MSCQPGYIRQVNVVRFPPEIRQPVIVLVLPDAGLSAVHHFPPCAAPPDSRRAFEIDPRHGLTDKAANAVGGPV